MTSNIFYFFINLSECSLHIGDKSIALCFRIRLIGTTTRHKDTPLRHNEHFPHTRLSLPTSATRVRVRRAPRPGHKWWSVPLESQCRWCSRPRSHVLQHLPPVPDRCLRCSCSLEPCHPLPLIHTIPTSHTLLLPRATMKTNKRMHVAGTRVLGGDRFSSISRITEAGTWALGDGTEGG